MRRYCASLIPWASAFSAKSFLAIAVTRVWTNFAGLPNFFNPLT